MQKTVQQQREEFLQEVWDRARRFRDAKRENERGAGRLPMMDLVRAERELFRVVDKFEWWNRYGTSRANDPTEADTQ
jgi:hypothetical protein